MIVAMDGSLAERTARSLILRSAENASNYLVLSCFAVRTIANRPFVVEHAALVEVGNQGL